MTRTRAPESGPSLAPGDRVLVSRLDYLGDVVLSLPLVDALRERWPGVEIDYMARRPGADLLAGDERFARVWRVERGTRSALRLISGLRKRGYRATIDLYSNPRSAWLTWSSGARVRIGGNRRGRRRLYTHPIAIPRDVRRVTDVFLYYGVPLGIPSNGRAKKPVLSVAREEAAAVDAQLSQVRASAGPLVGVHPGGKWSVKRWPTEKFVELVRILTDAHGARVVVFTGPDEREATDRVHERIGDRATYLEVMPVRTLAAVLSKLDAMVACDGGVMHLSAALGTPTVGIFGSSEPAVWFPYAGEGPYRAASIDVECRPCHRHECPLGHTRCLNELSAAAVAACVADVLSQARGVP
jgi:lipopolysaccharide heptosyltransferase II